MFKKLIIISLILLAIISIGAVSAAENISDTNLKTPEINEKMTIDAEKEIIKEESKESIETYITIKDKVYLDSSHPDIIQVDYVAGASGNITLDIDGEEVYNKLDKQKSSKLNFNSPFKKNKVQKQKVKLNSKSNIKGDTQNKSSAGKQEDKKNEGQDKETEEKAT